jgi:hypothetical protein
MTSLPDRLKLRHKLAALSVVGVAMCLLPLWQVMRFQSSEIDRSRAAEYGPDPAVLAVAVQRALLGHRDAAGQVLRGQGAVENERRELQVQVDLRLVELNHGVQMHGPQVAVQEAQTMRSDWLALASRVLKRSLTADASDAAHRLLVEQTLQVIDLVADASTLMRDPDPAIARLAQTLVRPMARLSVALLSSNPGTPQPGDAHDLKSAASAADAALLALATPDTNGVAPAQAIGDAAAGVRKAVQDHLQLQRDAQATPEALSATRTQALQAHTAAMTLLQGDLQQRLKARVVAQEDQRAVLGGLMLLLGLLATWLAASTLRATGTLERAVRHGQVLPEGVALQDGQSPLREATRWLWQRVRRPAAPAPVVQAERKEEQQDR